MARIHLQPQECGQGEDIGPKRSAQPAILQIQRADPRCGITGHAEPVTASRNARLCPTVRLGPIWAGHGLVEIAQVRAVGLWQGAGVGGMAVSRGVATRPVARCLGL